MNFFFSKFLVFINKILLMSLYLSILFVFGLTQVHREVMRCPSLYIEPNPRLLPFLRRIRDAGKRTFLLSNSPFDFIDMGMAYLLGTPTAGGAWPRPRFAPSQPQASSSSSSSSSSDSAGLQSWRDLFDLVMVSARKPDFYSSNERFREVQPESGLVSLAPARKLERGRVYAGGSFAELSKLTGLSGQRVLYLGDHMRNDLAPVAQSARWRKGAIVREVGEELRVMQTPRVQGLLSALAKLEALVAAGQSIAADDVSLQTRRLKEMRGMVRRAVRESFNSNFGSVFRTNTEKSHFFADVTRFADIYSADVTNFLHYPVNYTFYASRGVYPHEAPLVRSVSPPEHEHGSGDAQHTAADRVPQQQQREEAQQSARAAAVVKSAAAVAMDELGHTLQALIAMPSPRSHAHSHAHLQTHAAAAQQQQRGTSATAAAAEEQPKQTAYAT